MRVAKMSTETSSYGALGRVKQVPGQASSHTMALTIMIGIGRPWATPPARPHDTYSVFSLYTTRKHLKKERENASELP